MDYKDKFREWVKQNKGATEKQAKLKLAEFKRIESEQVTSKQSESDYQKMSFIDKVKNSALPNTMKSLSQGNKFPAASFVTDVVGAVPRYAEATLNSIGEAINPFNDTQTDPWERMAQTSTGSVISDALRAPENMFAVAGLVGKAPAVAQAVIPKVVNKLGQGGLLMRTAGKGLTGAAEQLPYTMANQGLQMEQGNASATNAGVELGLGAVVPVAGAALKRGYAGTPDGAKERALNSIAEASKSLISRFSGKSRDLLDYYGTKGVWEGFDKLKAIDKTKFTPDKDLEAIRNYVPNALEMVDNVVEHIDTGFKNKFIESNKNVQTALSEMGELDLSDVVSELKADKSGLLHRNDPMRGQEIPFGYRTGNEAIDAKLKAYDDAIQQITGEGIDGVEPTAIMMANDAYDVRKAIDAGVSWDKSKYSTALNSEIKKIPIKARTLVSNKLKNTAQKTSYPEDMEEMSKLLDIRDEFMNRMSNQGDADRAVNFIKTLGNTNKLENFKLAGDLKKILGEDLFEKTKILKLSQELGKGLEIYNDTRSGYANTGAILGDALCGVAGAAMGALGSSPVVAAPMTGVINATQNALFKYSPAMARFAPTGIIQSQQQGQR